MVKISAKERPHLNITLNNYDKLSEISKSNITSFTDNLLKVSKAGTYLVLVIGGVTIGANWVRNGHR